MENGNGDDASPARLFEPRGLNNPRRHGSRTDGWVGGRADTWFGHYRENPASRADADARRMASDEDYATEVAGRLRERDAATREDTDAELSIEPLSPGIGAIIHGVDMANPNAAQVKRIWLTLMVARSCSSGIKATSRATNTSHSASASPTSVSPMAASAPLR